MKCAVVDQRISADCERGLLKRGFRLIKLPSADFLSKPLCSHPDMLMFYHGEKIITSAEYCNIAPYVFSDIREYSPKTEILFTADAQSPVYPNDALFNALVINGKLIAKTDTLSPSVLEYARSCDMEIINVKQGYPACTTLGFGKSAITADKGMAKALSGHGINATLIKEGFVKLPPYEYGFIGGCAGIYGKEVYFCGDICRHPDKDIIEAALQKEGLCAVSLSNEELHDVGRIIFLD